MVHGTPAYTAIIAACVGEDGSGPYRIFPGTVEELERTGYDAALMPAEDAMTEAKMDALCRTALKHLDSMKALDADALMQQAVVVVMLFAAAERSASYFRGRQAELAYEFTLRRALFHHKLTAMSANEWKKLERMTLLRLEYRSWHYKHQSVEARERGRVDSRGQEASREGWSREPGRWKARQEERSRGDAGQAAKKGVSAPGGKDDGDLGKPPQPRAAPKE